MTRRFTAAVRAAGLPNHALDADRRRALLEDFHREAIRGQVAYHEGNAARLHRFHHRLHVAGMALFCITAAAVAVHLALMPFGGIAHSAAWLTIVSAVLPTCGAALLAIMNHGEFERVEKRSRSMKRFLESIDRDLAERQWRNDPPDLFEYDVLVLSVAAASMNEVADWRIVFSARPIRPPA
jgi:hypothetical protein